MNQIWKFQLSSYGRIEMPEGAEVLRVGLDPKSEACIWALVNTENPKVIRRFLVFATGEPIVGIKLKYVGTWNATDFVWHLFEDIARPIGTEKER